MATLEELEAELAQLKGEVKGPDRELADLEEQLRVAKAQNEFSSKGWLGQRFQTAKDSANLFSDAASMGYLNKARAGVRALGSEIGLGGGSYDEELAALQGDTQGASDRQGALAVAPKIAGYLASPSKASEAANWLTRAAVAGTEAGTMSALDAKGHDEATNPDAIASSAILGAGGHLVGETIGKTVDKASSWLREGRADPALQASSRVSRAAKDAGVDSARIAAERARLGPDAIAADIMGPSGIRVAKTASNISPEARSIIEDQLSGRKSLQNIRVADVLTDAAGLPRGVRDTPEDLQRSLYEARKPAIDEAYNAARLAGYDLPREPFADIIDSDLGRPAYDRAGVNLRNRSVIAGRDVASELGRLDETQRSLMDTSQAAYQRGERNEGSIAGGMARALKQRLDDSMAGPTYANARALARAQAAEQEAVQTGADLAGANLPSNLPRNAAPMRDEHAAPLAQGYALQQSGNLLNRGSTEGALARMNTPLGREAAEAALGPEQVVDVVRQLEAERAFNQTNRELTGNSTTARQLAEMAATTGGGGILGAAGAYATGYDPLTGGIMGAAVRPGLAGGKKLIERANAGRALARAPDEARLMMGALEEIPMSDPLAAMQTPMWRDTLARLMSRGTLPTYNGVQ